MAKATSLGPDVQTVSDQIKDMVGKFKMPGIDALAMVEQQGKNIGAIVEAMRVASPTREPTPSPSDSLNASTPRRRSFWPCSPNNS